MTIAEVFIPHGHCYLWKPSLVGLHIVSDGLIALAYYSIPITLAYFVQKRRDIPFNWIFLLFSAFIILCGTTHLIEIWTLWHPNYWLSGFTKAITAVVSLYTAKELIFLLPQALTMPSAAQFEVVKNEIQERLKTEAQLQQAVSKLQQEITERQQVEKEREQLLLSEQNARTQAETANRIKDEFLAVLSHELRTPLNPILGWTKLLRSRIWDEKTMVRALETIERNATLQIQLIEDLLDVSSILRGKISLNGAPVDLVSTIEAAIETMGLAAQAKSIQLQTVIEPTVGMVFGDARRLQQVIWNLISNAVKFTPNQGRVEVRLERNGMDAQIIVTDTGKGINPEFLPYVFEHFRQENSTTTRVFGGLGLGLAIVRHLVELHGGTVNAASPGEGLGATFTVTLPLMEIVPVPTQVNTGFDDAPTLKGIQVLVVDDDADTLEFISFLLTQYGIEVRAVASAMAALKVLADWQPDLLLSDIGMPQMDGYMLINKIRSLPPEQGGEIAAIALTAYARETDHQQILKAGFTQHLTKPVNPTELALAIASIVAQTAKNKVRE